LVKSAHNISATTLNVHALMTSRPRLFGSSFIYDFKPFGPLGHIMVVVIIPAMKTQEEHLMKGILVGFSVLEAFYKDYC
jgi:hypothetical protein